jgi:hypothetical protein
MKQVRHVCEVGTFLSYILCDGSYLSVNDPHSLLYIRRYLSNSFTILRGFSRISLDQKKVSLEPCWEPKSHRPYG